jgi:hypothetical protein
MFSTRSRSRRFVPCRPTDPSAGAEEWTSAGIVTRRDDLGCAIWSLFDPVTGTAREFGAGGPRGTPERWLSITPGGAAAIEPGDGRVFCLGAGCDLYRCVVGPRDARPFNDPACAHLRIPERANP